MSTYEEGVKNRMDFLSNFREDFLYNFMNYSVDCSNLKLKPVFINGKLVSHNSKFAKVTYMLPISNTRFPDVDEITIKHDLKGKRPAEVKFRTSQFEYHSDKKYKEKYAKFKINNGCIIVAKHDYLPVGLEEDNIDVFELDIESLELFGKENFSRLFNTQIRHHSYEKIWIMETSLNFYEGTDDIKPAIDSHIWCPTEHLTSLDLDINDKVIFIKTKGVSKQNVQGHKNIHEDWILDELYIAKVSKPIKNRKEYCQLSNISYMSPLWYDETIEGQMNSRVRKRQHKPINGDWRWKRVFEFIPVVYLKNLNININELSKTNINFANALKRTYGAGYSTEINNDVYTSIMEKIALLSNRII